MKKFTIASLVLMSIVFTSSANAYIGIFFLGSNPNSEIGLERYKLVENTARMYADNPVIKKAIRATMKDNKITEQEFNQLQKIVREQNELKKTS